MRWRIRLIVAVITAGATAVIALDSSKAWGDSQTDWHPTKNQVWAAVAFIAFSVFYNFADAYLEKRRATRRDGISVAVSERLFPLWYEIFKRVENEKAKEKLGVHVWLVPTWYSLLARPEFLRTVVPYRIHGVFWTPAMWRAAQFRLVQDEDPTLINWRRGKGAIGACWNCGTSRYYNLEALWGPDTMSRDEWNRLDVDVTLGLGYQEYVRVSSKYGGVLTVPIFRPEQGSNPQFLGCVVVDHPRDVGVIDLNEKEAKNTVRVAANMIASTINPYI